MREHDMQQDQGRTCTMSTRYARDCARGHDGSPAGLKTGAAAIACRATMLRLVPAANAPKLSSHGVAGLRDCDQKHPKFAWPGQMPASGTQGDSCAAGHREHTSSCSAPTQ